MTGGARRVAVVATPERARRAEQRAGELREVGHAVTVVADDGATANVTPPYLARSYALYRQLAMGGYDAIVFPSLGGHAYCSARAREVGAAFPKTAVVVDCDGFTDVARTFLSKNVLGMIATERLALELADAVVRDDGPITLEGAAPSSVGAGPAPVTVVVAFHERTTYVEQCLDGLARQRYEQLKVVIADDGSRSRAAADLLGELERRTWPWPLRIERLPRGGVSAARNGGWRSAESELVLFLDDDDVPFDDVVPTLVRARAASRADVAVAGARFFRGDGPPTADAGDVIRISLCEPQELGLLSNQYGGPVALWPRRLLERLGGFADVSTEDWDILARAAYSGARLTTPPDPLYWYRQTPGGRYSADPAAELDAGQPARVERAAEQLPSEWRLLPHIAAGAYEELERRKQSAGPRWRTGVRRLRMLVGQRRYDRRR